MLRLLRVVAGFAMLLVGVAGLILPIMPGWIFVIPGLIMLGREFRWARRMLDWAKKYDPRKSPET